MKKFYTLVAAFLLAGTFASHAQNVLLSEDFQTVMPNLSHILSPPPGNTVDTMWYDYDADQLPDGSGSSPARPDDWFTSIPYATADLYTSAGAPDTNVVMASNSWFTSPGQADNWLFTPNIQLGIHDTLFWKSAPRQTPRYLDGYEVKLSTTSNDDVAFTVVLKPFAEMTAIVGPNDSIFAGYTFSSPGFVHGLDGTYTEFQNDSARLVGKLRPFSIPLDAYPNQNVFIAFHHNSYDDNLISIDDIMVRGTLSTAGVTENSNDLNLNVFPNPATDQVQVNYTLSAESAIIINLYDVTGQLVSSEVKGSQDQGRHFAQINTSSLAPGFYTVSIQTNKGRSTAKLIVK